MQRSLAILVVSFVAVIAACDHMPRSHLITPALTGRLTKSGSPVAEASMLVVLRPESDTLERACSDELTTTETDSIGSFLTRAYRTWIRAKTAEEIDRSGQQFQLCVRPKGLTDFRVLFRGAANRWDRMTLDCDLDRDWLAPDQHGSSGRCVVTRVGVEGQPIAQRMQRPPALTCDTATTLLEPTRLGPIKLGAPTSELQRLCGRIRDTAVVDWTWDDAGQQSRAFVLDVAGQPIVFRERYNEVRDVAIISPAFRTADGFGVETSVIQLLEKPDLKVAFNAEPSRPNAFYYAWHGEECGVGYVIPPPEGFGGRPGGMVPTSEIRDWPATMRVSRMYIGWCPSEFLRGDEGEER